MLPYQLVPQVDAALLPQLQQQQQRLQQQQQLHHKPPLLVGAATDTTDSRRPLVERATPRQLGQLHEQLPSQPPNEEDQGNQYTDTSLQYADDSGDDEDDLGGGGGGGDVHGDKVWADGDG